MQESKPKFRCTRCWKSAQLQCGHCGKMLQANLKGCTPNRSSWEHFTKVCKGQLLGGAAELRRMRDALAAIPMEGTTKFQRPKLQLDVLMKEGRAQPFPCECQQKVESHFRRGRTLTPAPSPLPPFQHIDQGGAWNGGVAVVSIPCLPSQHPSPLPQSYQQAEWLQNSPDFDLLPNEPMEAINTIQLKRLVTISYTLLGKDVGGKARLDVISHECP